MGTAALVNADQVTPDKLIVGSTPKLGAAVDCGDNQHVISVNTQFTASISAPLVIVPGRRIISPCDFLAVKISFEVVSLWSRAELSSIEPIASECVVGLFMHRLRYISTAVAVEERVRRTRKQSVLR